MSMINNFFEPCNTECSYCFLNYTDVLGKNYLFRDISVDEIGDIVRKVHHRVKSYRKGDMIAYSGDEYNSLYIILSGGVVGELTDFEGKVLRVEELKAPDTIAIAFIFGQNNKLPVNVCAIEETHILIINRSDLLKLFKSHEKILHNYLNIMANRAQHLSKTIRMLAMQKIDAKLAHYMLEEMKGSVDNTIVLRHTQNELSEIFGVARPSVARVLRDLHKKRIIDGKGKHIKVLNPKALSALLK